MRDVNLTAVIGIQAMVNIGVAVGAMPVTGITLPFISYGGTSLANKRITNEPPTNPSSSQIIEKIKSVCLSGR